MNGFEFLHNVYLIYYGLYLFIIIMGLLILFAFIYNRQNNKSQALTERYEALRLQQLSRIIELEELLFLITDILHDEYKRSLFTQDELSYILTNARLFTRYGRVDINALQDNLTFIERDKQFIEYLKNDVWTKVYGKAFNECFKEKK